jgi:hypothetical protein
VNASDELEKLAGELANSPVTSGASAVADDLGRLEVAAREVSRAWSGSSLGYHANVYTHDLLPSGGRQFSIQWGLMRGYSGMRSRGVGPETVSGFSSSRCLLLER